MKQIIQSDKQISLKLSSVSISLKVIISRHGHGKATLPHQGFDILSIIYSNIPV